MTFTLTRSRAPETPASRPNVAARAVDAVKVYGKGEAEVRALDGVTVDFATGRFTAIMGPSGSGKSTLMHAVAGLDTLSGGSVWIGETELGSLSEKKLTQLRRDRIGFVFQSFNLLPTLNAEENITLPMDLAGAKPDKGWLDEVVRTVGLGDRLKHRPSELSGGQQQRVAVARALAGKPAVLLADEPTGNLDSKNGDSVMQLLAELHKGGATIVMVTHDTRFARHAERTIHIFDGRVVQEQVEQH